VLLAKAAAGGASKGFAANASAHHGHRAIAKKIGGKIVGKIRDDAINRALAGSDHTKEEE
jgi:hypothetical protein